MNVIMWTFFHLKKLLMFTNGIILTINRPYIHFETSMPFANSIHDTKYHTWCTMVDGKLTASGHLSGTLAMEPIAATLNR